jgi:hypothetical protein
MITVAQRSQDVLPLCAALATQKAELVSAPQVTSAESTFVRPGNQHLKQDNR